MPNTTTAIYYPHLFDYQEDGTIISNPKYKRRGLKQGKKIGTDDGAGYLTAEVLGKTLKVHRIIYEMFHGPIPKDYDLDHIDGCRSNNKIENLRLATRSQNLMNIKGYSKIGMPKNVSRNGKGFKVHVELNGKRYHGGSYKTVEEAEQAAIALRNELHGEYARHH